MNTRRAILGTFAKAAMLPGLARPALAARSGTLRFVPDADLTITDPIVTGAYATRLHALMVYDTLYGQDDAFRVQPQMVAGHRIEDGGLAWRLFLRDGLRFHDNTPVLAQDAVASLRRWATVDAFGQALMAATAELAAPSDRELRFRLRRPFPLLPDALGKTALYPPVIMPERLARLPASQPIREVVGSGPFRYVSGERLDGVRTVYERFAGYVPRPDGPAEFTAGPKVAHFDRVEWQVLPDDATALAALRAGEVDWWERPLIDALPALREAGLVVDAVDRTGFMVIVRFNQLHPPFDNPAVRRALLGTIDQAELMSVIAGSDRSLWTEGVGVFCPESPSANNAGIAVTSQPRDDEAARRRLDASGYRGERAVFLVPSNNQALVALGTVVADQARRAGVNVDLVAVDFGTWLVRRNSTEPPDKGGWSCTASFLPGMDLWDPANHLPLRGNGRNAWVGWPTDDRMEALRDAWLLSEDPALRRSLCRDIQLQAWQGVPYIPGGRWRQPTAYRAGLADVRRNMPIFYGVRG